ncbi:MAG: right-handed parallel beta-helix repeat-containing protein [Desulfuromonadales bacterium]|nr:right-handed parallel beta-helix repeat-containing protein [Desulfuromonadales bacterium]
MWRPKRLSSSILTLILLVLATAPGYAKELTSNQSWSGKVELKESLTVPVGATLTIKAGTRVTALEPTVKLTVRGKLLIQGSKNKPVILTASSSWEGVEFMEGEKGSRLSWAEFRAVKAAITSFASDFKVEHCSFKDGEFGVRLMRDSSPLIVDSRFENVQIGVANEMKSAAIIQRNRFINSSRSAILTSHGSRGSISGNHFENNENAIAVLQKYPQRIGDNTFINNKVAIYCNQSQSTPLIEDNRFEGNDIAVQNLSFAYPAIKNNRFSKNKTAIHNDQYGSPLVQNNLFSSNEMALYNYRKSNPTVLNNSFEQNQLAMLCDFSSYPEVRDNHFLGNKMGVKLGIFQSADWEKRSGSKSIMQRQSGQRKTKNPLLAQAPDEFSDFVDVSSNWWGDDTAKLKQAGAEGNAAIFHDRHDQPEVTYPDYGPGVYTLDRIVFAPWLDAPVDNVGPKETP